MDLVATAINRALYPLYVRWKGSTLLQQHRELSRTQFLPEEEIRRRQWASIQAVLQHAWEHNRFYRRRMQEHGAAPGDIRGLEDFARLPLLTKDDLRSNAEDLLSDDVGGVALTSKRTGGSTGVPVRLKWDEPARLTKEAVRLRHDAWAHFLVGRRRASLWGDVHPLTRTKDKIFAALFERDLFLDTIKMDERTMLEFVGEIRRTRTRLLFGHGHSIYYFARFVKDHSITDITFDGIISTAEMLPQHERRLVEEVFGRNVFDRYGCEEVGLIASECAEHTMHVAAESVHVELLGADEHTPGRIVITDLLNRATPLVRYEIGDLATARAGRCACGRGLPCIGSVTGRTSDVLYSPDGRRVSGISILDTVTIHIPGFRQVQVVQEKLDELTFNVVKDGNFSGASLAKLSEAVSRYFGAAMKHDVVFVDKVPLTGRGKFQFSICKLSPSELDRLERALGPARQRLQ